MPKTTSAKDENYSVLCYGEGLRMDYEVFTSSFSKAIYRANKQKLGRKWKQVVIKRNKGARVGQPVMWRRDFGREWKPFMWKGAVEFCKRREDCEHPNLFL